MSDSRQQAKETVAIILDRNKQISLPEIRSPDGEQLQDRMFIEFDSIDRVDRDGSIVDFIIKKGSAEVLIGLSDGWLSLTADQRERIESAGKSFMILRTDLTDDWAKTLYTSVNPRSITLGPFGTVEHHTQTAYWVYHTKHGWQNGAQ